MIKKLRVTVDGNTYEVTVELPDDAATPVAASASAASAVAATPPVAHTPPAPAATPATPADAPASAGPGDVPSPLAGRVTAVVVTTGQEVKEGDHLLTLEAMKMNTFVFAPQSGKVAEIKTEVGAAVEEGQALVRIE
jgi:glutaconyl-CoA/methylmalonyl-CoA decarboxylase subunit gamma